MSLPSANNKNPTVTVGLAANLPNPVSVTEGTIYYASDTDTLYVLSISTAGIRSWGISGGNIVNSPVNIFANALTGNDANPGTSALPVLTLQQAMILATVNRSTVSTTITLVAGNFMQPADEVLSVPFPMPGALPLRIVGLIKDSGLGPITATGGTTGTAIPLAAGTITGAFVNHAFKKQFGTWLPGSANAGVRFVIQDNSTTTVTANFIFASAPLNNDTFSVGAPNVAIIITNTLTFVGGPLLLDSIQFDVPSTGSALHAGIALNFHNTEVQENGCYYLGGAAGSSPIVQWALLHRSGQSVWSASQPSCGCIYDGSASGGQMIVASGVRGTAVNILGDTIAAILRFSEGTQSLDFTGLHLLTASSVGVQNGGSFVGVEGIYSGMVSATGQGVGPGCIAARDGSVIQLALCDFEASGAGGFPLVSGDQSRVELGTISGTNAGASLVLSLKSGSTAAVAGITATNTGGTTLAQVGGNAATSSIAGVVGVVNDLAVIATSQLCYLNSPT